MKTVWIEVLEWDKGLITDALENGVDAFFTDDEKLISKIKELAKVEVYSKKSLPENIKFININSKDDEIKAGKINEEVSLIIDTGDWKIIPFENIIAQRKNIFAKVSSIESAIEAAGILEKGVDGVYISECSSEEKIKILKKLKSKKGKINLSKGEVISVTKLITGDRVCIDTIANMTNGEGMLIGDYSNGMVLVNSESMENPYVASRPLRVNAGAVHCYVMTPDYRTHYIADLKSGDEILIVNHKGETYTSAIGRIKQEKRPLLRIEIKGKIKIFSVILQNAETIRVVTPDGGSKSVVALQAGDKVVIFEEEGGRHFGFKIEETIEEK
jgi:3-dehydroquinate synthase II